MQRKLCMISRASGDCPSLARQVKFPGKIFEKIYIEKLQSVCDERLGGLVRITTNSLYIILTVTHPKCSWLVGSTLEQAVQV